MKAKFEPGEMFITRDCKEEIPHDTRNGYMDRHLSGDWGDCSDPEENNLALDPENPGRLLSVFRSEVLPTVWIITEADRSSTTVLLASEY